MNNNFETQNEILKNFLRFCKNAVIDYAREEGSAVTKSDIILSIHGFDQENEISVMAKIKHLEDYFYKLTFDIVAKKINIDVYKKSDCIVGEIKPSDITILTDFISRE